MKKRKLLLLLFSYLTVVSCKDAKENLIQIGNPTDLRYTAITDARETRAIATLAPTVQTAGLIPTFELVSITKSDGTLLDQSYLQYVTIGKYSAKDVTVNTNGNPTTVKTINSSSNGVITVAAGHNFTPGDYDFTIKVSTEAEGKTYSTVFNKVFHLRISPLLPTNLIYSPKNQNLVYGSGSKTSMPIMPSANPDVYFELGNYADKLIIDKQTGAISLAQGYVYTARESLQPVVKVISNISGEVVTFEDKITVVITDAPETMPSETIYLFYPTLNVNAAYPTGGVGYTVQTNDAGVAPRIWGSRTNGAGGFLVTPAERPVANTGQTVLETVTFNAAGITTPVNSWMVTTTQDLTPYQYGYKLSFNYYYVPAYQVYMADGRTPTDLEVYISTDYKGGDIQDAQGNWLNGTWTQVNANIRCQRSSGVVASGQSSGAPWDAEFIGTPYPGDQKGVDPDGKKRPQLGTFYGKWVKCSYEISSAQITKNVTVAFKVASYFTGQLQNNTTVPGRGGSYFISDFNYKAQEP